MSYGKSRKSGVRETEVVLFVEMDSKRKDRDEGEEQAPSKRSRKTTTSEPGSPTDKNVTFVSARIQTDPVVASSAGQTEDINIRQKKFKRSSNIATPASSNSSVSDRGSKGLRHFSLRVCQKVEEKGCTTYNEVAEELVNEMKNSQNAEESFDQKNIRRRVYDALNVLMAMDIIRKDKKEIRWIGLPTNSLQEVRDLEREKKERSQAINNKKAHLQELMMQKISLKKLIDHNAKIEQNGEASDPSNCVHLPFILVKTDQATVIDCDMSADKTYYHFRFKGPFEINDDIEVLSRMGMHKCLPSEAQAMVDPEMIPFLPENMQATSDNIEAFEPQLPPFRSSPPSSPSKHTYSSLSSPPSMMMSSPLREPMTSPSMMSSSPPSSPINVIHYN